MHDDDGARGTKRPASESLASRTSTPVSFEDLRPANFHQRPLGGVARRGSPASQPADLSMYNAPAAYQPAPVQGYEGGHQSYEIINNHSNLSQFQQPLPDLENL